ncbi:toxin [Streptomonospora alba]|uniref:Toxin n=1 Tax=Streptomonospora alba TaxID=183763 RepID=A0A0C2JHD1_9ACTN|nr:DUF397 domain-containing protein [Streptomonospora alba]KIH96402.1 toxin [Streptomonospora alba]
MEIWKKSTYSGGNGGDCIEVAANWRKSSYSGGVHQDCVEVAESPQQVHIRDTKHRDAGYLSLPAVEWSAFLADLKGGRL